ncbi:amino acid permease [Dysgonomonas macrotermitis]|uniref:Amino acid/polyamine/organocation transporter, APC superfamily n=1 Tax=Dysgonomonas macrotermitis TaxID=1346286 RepID=A0A1M5F119_9BACT|nr:amino acid permease [Dysgonomonas macrotermitis]SHF85225.1 amino acid/polyamine/organocation transporter, APC superfamily [Dysgonomonas macrotermitis]
MLEKIFRKKDIHQMLTEAEGSNDGLRRNLTAANLVTLGIGAIVGTGIFVITGTAAANYAGPGLTISFLISVVGCIMAGLCYAEFAAMIPVAGSVYSYSYSTMGEGLAWFIGWVLVLEYLFACSSVAVGWSGYIVSLCEGWGIHLPQHLSYATFDHTEAGWVMTGSLFNFPAVFIIVLVSTLLLGGIKQSAFINNIIVVIKVGVILLFIGFGLSYIDTSNWDPYIPANTGSFGEFGWSGVLRGAGVVFYAYLGFDALSTAAQEAKNPQRDMPKGILISLLICAVLYISVTAILTGIVNYKDLDVAAPIALAIDRTGSGLAWLSPFIKLGAIAGLSSVILVMMLAQSRIYYSISKDGLLPKFLSKIHKKSGIPHRATFLACVITSVFAGLFPLHVLTELVSIGTLMAFSIVCISILVLRKTQPDLKRPFKTPFVPFVPLLGAGVCIMQMLALPWGTWVRLIIWTLAGLILYLAYGQKHSVLNKSSLKK